MHEIENEVGTLYEALLTAWNQRDAERFASLFAQSGNVVGFDGSVVNGQAEIATHLRDIFAHHQTPAYIGVCREIRQLSADVAIVRAVAGMMPPGGSDINPAANAIQTLVVARHDGTWRIELFQNTPAAFHGRPEESASLTQELREALRVRSATA